jgi:hypothetical protein
MVSGRSSTLYRWLQEAMSLWSKNAGGWCCMLYVRRDMSARSRSVAPQQASILSQDSGYFV